MTMFKAQWDTEGDSVRLSMPFSKVDVERRMVSGFATLDNVDKQNDIVTTEASVKAFSKFRGNIREMHQPSAVGKMISFREDKYFDPESKKFYSGVYVSAYISKGAQNTWEKVIDGTYTGFSIGGRMNKWDDAYDEKMDAQIRIIKDYDLVELSLVDNPANQFASILSIEKVDGVDIIKGEAAETVLENVFWDADSGIVMLSEEDNVVSPTSGEPMKNIGFVEKSDSDKKDMIKFLVDSAKGINTSKITKEVSPMTDETTELVEKAEEVVLEEVVEKSDEVAPEADAAAESEVAEEAEAEEAEVEKADDAEAEVAVEKAETTEAESVEKSDEVIEEAAEVSKSDEVAVDAVADIKDTITSAFSDLAETVKALHAEVNALKKSITGVSEEVAAAKQEISEAKGQFDEFGKRVDAVEQDTAFRKSGDLGEIVQEQPELVEKSLWGGRFLKTADLFK
jgi:outer membrane murein-binding lipoprotein Lpp